MKLLYEVYISFLYLAWVCFHPWIFHENECGFTKRKTASSEYEDSQRIPFNSTMLLYTGMSEGFILSYNVRLLQQKCAFGVLFCRLVPTWESIKYTDMPQVLCLSLKSKWASQLLALFLHYNDVYTFQQLSTGESYTSESFPGGTSGKELACKHRRRKRRGFDPWVGKISWRTEWQSIPVFLSGESHGQRSLMGYSPWDHKELDMTEAT